MNDRMGRPPGAPTGAYLHRREYRPARGEEVRIVCEPPCRGRVTQVDERCRCAWVATEWGELRFGWCELRQVRG